MEVTPTTRPVNSSASVPAAAAVSSSPFNLDGDFGLLDAAYTGTATSSSEEAKESTFDDFDAVFGGPAAPLTPAAVLPVLIPTKGQLLDENSDGKSVGGGANSIGLSSFELSAEA